MLAALFAFLRPGPVAVVAGLVLFRYAVLLLFLHRAMRVVRAEEALAADPTRAELYFEVAFARLGRGRVREAVSAFRQGVGLDPELDLDRPAELAGRLLARPGMTPARRKVAVYLVTAALFDRMLENLDDTLPAGVCPPPVGADGEPRVLSVRDVAGRLEGSARERFLEHCRGLVHSLRVEIAGLEQLVVALDGDSNKDSQDEQDSGSHPVYPVHPVRSLSGMTRAERDRQRRMLEREIERLRAHAGEIDSAIRHALRRRGKDAGAGPGA